MNFFSCGRTLKEGMRISRGGFTERVHLFANIESDFNQYKRRISINETNDIIASGKDLKDILLKYHKDLKRVDFSLQASENYEKVLRDTTYPEQNSTLMALMSSLSTCYQLRDVQLSRNPEAIRSISDSLYASNSYWTKNLDEMVDLSLKIISRGVKKIKHHVGVLSPIEESRRCNILLDKILSKYPDSKHAFDLNCAYTFEDAREFLSNISPSFVNHILWIEEPLHFNQYSLLGDLELTSQFPIAAGENALGIYELLSLTKAISYVMPDLGRNCDFNSLRLLIESSSKSNSKVTLHNYGSLCLLSKTLKAYTYYPELVNLEIDLSYNPLNNIHWDSCSQPDEWINAILNSTHIDLHDDWTFSLLN